MARRIWGSGSLHQRNSDGRWIGIVVVDGRKRYVTGVDHDDVVRRCAVLTGGSYTAQDPLASEARRFWGKVDKTDTCWLWISAHSAAGYGQFRLFRGAKVAAHRFAYRLLVGPIPQGLELDHLCRTPACVRPDHLEPVTHTENIRRGFAARSS